MVVILSVDLVLLGLELVTPLHLVVIVYLFTLLLETLLLLFVLALPEFLLSLPLLFLDELTFSLLVIDHGLLIIIENGVLELDLPLPFFFLSVSSLLSNLLILISEGVFDLRVHKLVVHHLLFHVFVVGQDGLILFLFLL